MLLLDETEVARDFAADLFQILKLALELIPRLSLIIQLFFELRDVGLAAHLAKLRLSRLHLGGRFEVLWHLAHIVLGLLIKVSFIVCIWVLNFEVIEVGTGLLLNLVERLSHY